MSVISYYLIAREYLVQKNNISFRGRIPEKKGVFVW